MTPAQITEARQSLGLTGVQLSAMLGLRKTGCSEYERGIRQPSGAALRLLRAYLDGYRPDDWPV